MKHSLRDMDPGYKRLCHSSMSFPGTMESNFGRRYGGREGHQEVARRVWVHTKIREKKWALHKRVG